MYRCGVRRAPVCLPDVGCDDGLIPGRAFLTPQEFGQTFRDKPLWAMEGRFDRVSDRQAGLNEVSAVGVSATILEGVMLSKQLPRTTSTGVGSWAFRSYHTLAIATVNAFHQGFQAPNQIQSWKPKYLRGLYVHAPKGST